MDRSKLDCFIRRHMSREIFFPSFLTLKTGSYLSSNIVIKVINIRGRLNRDSRASKMSTSDFYLVKLKGLFL